ncbi:hypothetical protein [Natrarchaeobius oligotrophus]|uniref:hypothetical protein n=1 Tax=Natrarchaeobius oligotrophus TaxID=3455743 RepID=UPI000F532B49|nr:hypothetical protein [Natrarchaeobius chitinivorans]
MHRRAYLKSIPLAGGAFGAGCSMSDDSEIDVSEVDLNELAESRLGDPSTIGEPPYTETDLEPPSSTTPAVATKVGTGNLIHNVYIISEDSSSKSVESELLVDSESIHSKSADIDISTFIFYTFTQSSDFKIEVSSNDSVDTLDVRRDFVESRLAGNGDPTNSFQFFVITDNGEPLESYFVDT